MSLTKATYSMINGAPFNVLDYGAKGDGTTDDTAAIQAAIDAAQLITGSTYLTATHCNTVYAPAGVYKITATINIPGNVNFIGDGNTATIFNMVSATPIQSFLIGPSSDNQYMWGSSFKGFRINCSGGAGVCDGFKLQTGNTNSIITQTEFDDILVFNSRTGFELSGVLYMLDFRNCKVVGTTYRGFVTTGAKEIIYNSFTNIEVTNVANNALAFFMNSAASQYTNITADGCCKFGGAYTGIDGLSVEGISATTPFSTTCIEFNQISSARDIAIINVPTAKCNLGINVIGSNLNIGPIKFPDAGVANQPTTPIFFGSTATGLLTSVSMANCANKITFGSGGLGNVVAISCDDITVSSLNYLSGTWTPTFSSWTTNPTTITATYSKIGRQVTINFFGQDGVATTSSIIGGLPFTSSSTSASAVCGSCSDSAKRIAGSIVVSTTSINNLVANTLTGTFWQMSATYFV